MFDIKVIILHSAEVSFYTSHLDVVIRFYYMLLILSSLGFISRCIILKSCSSEMNNRIMEKIVDPDGIAHKAIPSGSILIVKVFEVVLLFFFFI